jgi:hypothetical protein
LLVKDRLIVFGDGYQLVEQENYPTPKNKEIDEKRGIRTKETKSKRWPLGRLYCVKKEN